MKRFFVIGSLSFAFILFGCSGTPKEKTTAGVECEDMHNVENSLDYPGLYKGVLPSADSQGMDVSVSIFFDQTFEKKTVSPEREGATSIDKGQYRLEDALLTLYFENGEVENYRVGEGQITLLDKDKQVIEGEFADMYILTQEEVFER